MVEYPAGSLAAQGLEVLLGTRKTGWNSPDVSDLPGPCSTALPLSLASSLGLQLKIWMEEWEHRA